jgi:hypothetical protein
MRVLASSSMVLDELSSLVRKFLWLDRIFSFSEHFAFGWMMEFLKQVSPIYVEVGVQSYTWKKLHHSILLENEEKVML